jgi:hypothetical protein
MDRDFDGKISQDDLRKFLLEELEYFPEQVTPNNISRLYKLMDTFKRDSIELPDLQKLINC